MTYPPANLGARTDASPAVPSSHAADHTAERNAINAIVAELGSSPKGDFATVMARLDAIEAAIAALGGSTSGGGSGGSGSGGSGSGGGAGESLTTPTKLSLGDFSYPIDVTSVGVSAGLDNLGNYTLGWAIGDLSAAGLYAKTLFLRVTGGVVAVNLENTAQKMTFGATSMYTGPVVESAGSLFWLYGSGRRLSLTSGANWIGSGTEDIAGPWNHVRLETSWLWASSMALYELSDTTGTITKRIDLPGAASGAYYCERALLNGIRSIFVMRSSTLALDDPDHYQVWTYSIASDTFVEWASASYYGLPTAVKSATNSPFAWGTMLSDGRFINVVNGEIVAVNTQLVATPTGNLLWGGTTTRGGDTLSGSGRIFGIAYNASAGTWQINKATDTYSEIVLPATSEKITNLHWKPEHENSVLRWNQGRKLMEMAV